MRLQISPDDRRALQHMVLRLALRSPRPTGGRVHVANIIDLVAYEMGVCRADLISSDRSAGLFRARAAVCWLSRQLTQASLPRIGVHLGGRHHSSVLAACRRAADMRERDPAFRQLTDTLIRHFRDLQED